MYGHFCTTTSSAKSFLELNHYAVGGVMGCGQPSCPQPPLRLRGRTGVFRRREVYLLACLFKAFPSLRLDVPCLCVRGASSCRGALLAGLVMKRFVFFCSTSSRNSTPFPMRGVFIFQGSRTCLSVAAKDHCNFRIFF